MFIPTELFGPIQSPKAPTAPLAAALPAEPIPRLQALFQKLIPDRFLAPKANSRRRLYTLSLTFWAFLHQVLHQGGSCRKAVSHLQALQDALPNAKPISSDTSPYCQARRRLPLEELVLIRQHLSASLEAATPAQHRLAGRPLRVVDGTILTLPDTPALQAAYPQPGNQKPGCGFPKMRLVALLSLDNTGLLAEAHGTLSEDENRLFRQLFPHLQAGAIVVGDRYFGTYANLADLQAQGVDGLFRLHGSRRQDLRQGRCLSYHERLVTWQKPKHKPRTLTEEEFDRLPPTIQVRILRVIIATPGFRTRSVTLVSTLLDLVAWPAERLAQMFLRRWEVELFLDDIKTTLRLDVLRCRCPDMVAKELQMHLIAYQLIRHVMLESVLAHQVPLGRLSFQGTIDRIHSYSEVNRAIGSRQAKRRRALYEGMLRAIATDLVPHRPGRREPRCRKARPKPYPLLDRPRHQMQDRNKRDRQSARRGSKCATP
jgi:hypothetical protein